jgi:hypothetical protein
LQKLWLNFAIFLLSLILSSLSEAKSFPASSTCFNKKFQLLAGCCGSSLLPTFFPYSL